MRLNKKILADYEGRAAAERQAGTTIEINTGIPYIAIDYIDGECYFMQGCDSVYPLLDEVPENISPEDYILAVSRGW